MGLLIISYIHQKSQKGLRRTSEALRGLQKAFKGPQSSSRCLSGLQRPQRTSGGLGASWASVSIKGLQGAYEGLREPKKAQEEAI